MEEIDSIIIESLKHLECDLNDEIQTLKQFDADTVLNAVSTCLEAIKPGNTFPKKMPPSMSQKLKITTDLAQQIKDLGFRGDMGYQTILYCNEVEVRRVLMFLVERLPRDASKVVQIEQTGYVPRLIKQIEENLKRYNKQMWVPSSLLNNGARECSSGYIVNTFGNSCFSKTTSLVVPNSSDFSNELLKQYWVHVVPDVTKQCSSRQLIPSLLFKDNEFDKNEFTQNILQNNSMENIVDIQSDVKTSPSKTSENICDTVANNQQYEEKIPDKVNSANILLEEVQQSKNKYKFLQEAIKRLELQLSQVNSMKIEEEELLKTTQSKIKLKTKTLAVANKEENLLKLKQMVENASEHLLDLANQWNKVQAPLLDEYRSLHNTLSSEEIKIQQDEAKLHILKNIHNNLVIDWKEKEILERNLVEKCQEINKNNNRSSYTKRILEIIGNIKKQNVEIQKVLQDTKEVQKDINNLTGQVDRSFTFSDEIIFYDAKHDETARRAYKLLAGLRDECSAILKGVTDLGLTERESRNLQEQVDTEKSKEIAVKLQKVTTDLEEMKKETQMLLKGREEK